MSDKHTQYQCNLRSTMGLRAGQLGQSTALSARPTNSSLHCNRNNQTPSSSFIITMATASFSSTPLLPHENPTIRRNRYLSVVNASSSNENGQLNRRRLVSTTLLAAVAAEGITTLLNTPVALAEKWGVRSFLREKYFEPGLSAEDAAARIKQTAEGLHSLRHMLETMSWRYVLFYIRLKSSYLDKDLKNVMTLLPEGRRKAYVTTANQLVENMSQLDVYVRTPKVYESYLYYEKALKSIDEVVSFLA